ncbi:membrane protein [Mesorhizobium sp. L-8-10]|uniref:TPM domain-containing protein n=1 Tax=Mesorhizobium sp. L-8-3 TaxID=2744522 RepID=UPI001937AC41|nr:MULTISPECIES: YgcG family protein [unclassified Mesorhizobium]BCH21823.1 membrane protein [Mesorhizobium sp. L-8-3]BCH29512.1 membrane protein [Mesorhizobium sp. L-8-10]
MSAETAGIACAILLLLFLPFAAIADDLPALTGRVVDDAGLIDAATSEALTRKLADFETKSSDQIVVATVPTTGGEAIEPYANRLFRAWKLGQAGEDNGILLLVARDDRKMRIEVGYGLEGTLTDLHSKLIIENTMVPAFRAGDFPGGISGAVDDIIMVLEGNGAELQARAERNQATGPDFVDLPVLIFIAIWATLFFGGLAMAFLPPMFGRKIGPGRYRWLGMDFDYNQRGGSGGGYSGGGGWSSGSSSGGWSSGGGGFSGGGGSSGGGGASGSW